MEIPALGPSFGEAPDIKWTWMLFSLVALIYSVVKYLKQLILAIVTLSYKTFLILPEIFINPFLSGLDGSNIVSTVITWPI